MSSSDDDRPPPKHPQSGDPEPSHPKGSKSRQEAAGPAEKKEHLGLLQRPLLAGLIMLGVVVAAVAGALIWIHSRDFVTTDDAFIDVISEQASAQIAGRVLRVLIADNEDVKAGQLLVQLDPADLQARVDQALAADAQAQAQLAEAVAQEASATAQAEQARASAAAADATRTNAASDLARYRALRRLRAAAVAQQQLDSAEAAARTAEAQARAASKSVTAADAQIASARSRIAAAKAAIQSASSQVAEARLNLSYTEVRAQIAGRVASKTVSPGNYIQPGAPLMAIVPREVYVTANFKETQLAHMRRGQGAEVAIDSYPDLKIPAHVDSVQAATGQAFSILPAENATGNWVKIVQRVPVKILFDRLPDSPDQRLGPGMSVEVKVSVR